MAHILIIDDDELVREQVEGWLQRAGYTVTAACNGREGLEMALAQPPDLIVCDISMPEMSGYDVLVELRGQTRTAMTPFIFLTGQSDKSFMRHGMELGADDYLTKPFTRGELTSAVQTRFQRRAAAADSYQREVDEIKTNLTRMVTHELKTPLVNIDLVKQIIERQVDHLSPAELKELIASLGTGTDRLHHLIEQMVYATQLDSGVLSEAALERDGVSVAVWQILPAAIDLGRRFAFRNKHLSIQTADQDPHAAVLAHPLALKHALAELIANALNYSAEDGRVSVAARQMDSGVWVKVVDQGQGMSEAQRARALRPFEQVSREQNEQQGVGMGLPLAKRIIEVHGGMLDIHSVEGRGTQVILRFPTG